MAKVSLIGEPPVLIPEGEYTAIVLGHETSEFLGNGKLSIRCLISSGRHEGVKLDRHFNVQAIRNAKDRGEFGVMPGSDYCRLMRKLFGHLEESGEDWLSPDNLDGQKVEIEVCTVKTNHRREELESSEWYSKVKRILKIVSD